jgi:hypothetical protein
MGVIADRAGEHPSGMHVGQVQCAGELALERRAAVRHGIPLEEPRLRLDLIASSADFDRIAQQWRGLRRRNARYLVLGPRGLQITIDAGRTHRQQFVPHLGAVAVTPELQLAVTFQPVELQRHRGGKILPALPTRSGPHPLQNLQRVIGVLWGPRPTGPRSDTAARPWRPSRRLCKPAPSVITRPARHRHHLIQNQALVLLRGLHIRRGVPGGDLGPRRHRQPTSHA